MSERRNQIKEICSHYDEFYAMTLAAAFVNSCSYGDYIKDAEKLIDFIGSAFEFQKDFISLCKSYIFGEMQKIGLVSDYHALGAIDCLTDYDIENLPLYEVKGRAIEEVNYSAAKMYRLGSKNDQDKKADMKYKWFHHAYEAHLRFEQIKRQAAFGDVNSTRQLGLLYALGIGCEADETKAQLHLKRCVLWGDIVATALLGELYARSNNMCCQKTRTLLNLEKKYLNDGFITIPDTECASDEVATIYNLISLIRQNLVFNGNVQNIDSAFADVILNRNVPLKSKLRYIVKYNDATWKNTLIYKTEKKKAGFIG